METHLSDKTCTVHAYTYIFEAKPPNGTGLSVELARVPKVLVVMIAWHAKVGRWWLVDL